MDERHGVIHGTADASRDGDATWFGHPRGLTILFLTEAWEKFSYFGMRAILMYYIISQLHFPQAKASTIVGLYGGLVYFTPLVGGAISDRWLSRKTGVVVGGVIMAAGHFMMSFESLLYVALATITIGNGLYLPNLPAQVPALYAAGDPRAKVAMNVYYVGINIGAFAAPLVCGTLGEVYGWHYGFTTAGIGMLAGLGIYLLGQRYLPPEQPRTRVGGKRLALDPDARKRMLLLLTLMLPIIVFSIGFGQVFVTLPLWILSDVDLRAGSLAVPMTWFMSLDPLFVFIFTPFLVRHWERRERGGIVGSMTRRMSMGAVLVGAAYFLLAGAALLQTQFGVRPSWLWVVAFFVLLTLGELYLYPVSLALFGRLAPARLAATAVALWYSTAFFGSIGGGFLGRWWSVLGPVAFFALTGLICLLSALPFLLMAGAVRRAEPVSGAVPA